MRQWSMCFECKHISFDGRTPVCSAFPDGVPRDILFGDEGHTQPYPGDNGIRFEHDPSALGRLRDAYGQTATDRPEQVKT